MENDMRQNYYNFHNIILVAVDKEVDSTTQSEIEFQIGHFKTESKVKTKYMINISAYSKYKKEADVEFVNFHLAKGIEGKCYLDENNSIYIEKGENCYRIYVTNSPYFSIITFIHLFMLKEGYTFIHSSGVANSNGHVTLFPGPGGVGKTTILNMLVKDNGYSILGDDLILIGGQYNALSYPRHLVLKDYYMDTYPEIFNGIETGRRKKAFLLRLFRKSLKNLPFADIFITIFRRFEFYKNIKSKMERNIGSQLITSPIEKIFSDNCIVEKGEVCKIVFLERYSGKDFLLTTITKSDLTNRLFSIIQHELHPLFEQFFAISSIGMIDLYEYYFKSYSIIKEVSKTIDDIRLLKIPCDKNPREFSNYYQSLINSGLI